MIKGTKKENFTEVSTDNMIILTMNFKFNGIKQEVQFKGKWLLNGGQKSLFGSRICNVAITEKKNFIYFEKDTYDEGYYKKFCTFDDLVRDKCTDTSICKNTAEAINYVCKVILDV